MKNIFALLIIASTLFSCSSSDDSPVVTSKVLQKVVFYKNSASERQWIISNNLLEEIHLADGTLAEDFIYDTQNRVVKDIIYNNGVVSRTIDITYNADGTIKTIDNLPYTYNAATRTYKYSYGSNFTIDCEVNEDRLAVNFVRNGFNPGEYHMAYSNGNMTSFQKITNGTTEVTKNFNYSSTLINNPITDAVMDVARVKSLTDPSFFIDCHASKGLPVGFDKGSADTNYYNYGAVPGEMHYQVGIEVLDSSNNFVEFYPFADYYYQKP